MLSREQKKTFIVHQRKELTEYYIYKKLASASRNEKHRKILLDIADNELEHYKEWKSFTGKDVKPYYFLLWKMYFLCRIFGLTFTLKLMESGEVSAQEEYSSLNVSKNKKEKIISEENLHELKLIEMIDEEHLKYISSMVLGLNDALVEMTGALAGFTLALKDSRMIALVGLITGISATLSMASSEYLSQRTEENSLAPARASFYTGLTYFFTVLILTFPFIFFSNYIFALILTLVLSLLIILFFNFYISVTKNLSFKRTFWEMAIISFGVAFLSFIIGYVLRYFFNIEA